MKVRELIEKLQEFDPELPVAIVDEKGDPIEAPSPRFAVQDATYLLFVERRDDFDGFRFLTGPHVRVEWT